jgi:hypothetical protein
MKALKALVLAVLMMLVAVPLVGAQVGQWDSSCTIVNMGSAAATVNVTFYDAAGVATTPPVLSDGRTNPFTLAAGASAVVYLPSIPTLPDGTYSVVVSADQPIAAIANLIGVNGAIYFNGSYSGAEDESQVAQYLPSINKAFYTWNSHLSIQNLTAAAMDITVNFYVGFTAPVIAPLVQNVAAYAFWHLDVGAVAGLPDGYNGSVVVTAPGPIAAIDNQTADPNGLTQDYNGFNAGATTLYCPALYFNYYTWNSSLNVQNVGTVTTTVNVAYSDGTSNSHELGPNAAFLFYQPDEAGHLDTFSAVVTSAEPVVAIVNAANPMAQAQTYNCFSAGTTSFFAPIVEKNYYGWTSGVQAQNIGTIAADVTVTFETPGCSRTVNVAAGGTAVFYQGDDACLPDGYGASATITSAQPIVVIVNQTLGANQTGDQGDWSMSYNAFGQ